MRVLYVAIEGYLLGTILADLVSMVTIRTLQGFTSIVVFWFFDAAARILAIYLTYRMVERVLQSQRNPKHKRLVLGLIVIANLAVVISSMLSVIWPAGNY